MKIQRLLSSLCFPLFVLAACHYSGSVKPFGYEGAAVGEKIDGVVAYQSGSAKIQPVRVNAPFSNYDIRLDEAIDKAFLDLLTNRFREVRPVAGEGVTIRFEPSFIPTMRYMDMNGNVSIDLDLRLVAVDMTTGEVSEVFAVKEPMSYSPPTSSTFLGVLTGLSLFILSPITMPLNAQVCGSKAVEDLQRALRSMVVTIDADMGARRPRLVGMALGGPNLLREGTRPQEAAPSRYDAILDCVVVVRSRKGQGSGFFVSGNGHLLTNHHVVEGDAQPTIRLRSGATVLGRVVAVDPKLDLAVIETGLTKTAWLPLAASEEVEVGADVIAVGTPKGLDWSVTKGIVSATGRGEGGVLIQTDAAINTGNSGGPLVSVTTGKVFGISTLILRGDGAEGLGFAVAAPFISGACAHYLPPR